MSSLLGGVGGGCRVRETERVTAFHPALIEVKNLNTATISVGATLVVARPRGAEVHRATQYHTHRAQATRRHGLIFFFFIRLAREMIEVGAKHSRPVTHDNVGMEPMS